jgi:hypothetical protein
MSVKSMDQETEYFARLEVERRKQARAEQENRATEEEHQRVSTVAQHHCPKCGAPLVTVAYRNIAIDKCSHCQGVWLDYGELERVLAEGQWFLSALKRIFA